MRPPGIVQTFASMSISSQLAPIVSLVRVADRMVNSSARAISELCSRSSDMNAGSSA